MRHPVQPTAMNIGMNYEYQYKDYDFQYEDYEYQYEDYEYWYKGKNVNS